MNDEMTDEEYLGLEHETQMRVPINTRRRLTFEDYVEIGKKCKKIEALMLEISDVLTSGHLNLKTMKGISGKGTRSFSSEAMMIQKKMMMMKSDFDDNLARDYPDQFDVDIFYGRR